MEQHTQWIETENNSSFYMCFASLGARSPAGPAQFQPLVCSIRTSSQHRHIHMSKFPSLKIVFNTESALFHFAVATPPLRSSFQLLPYGTIFESISNECTEALTSQHSIRYLFLFGVAQLFFSFAIPIFQDSFVLLLTFLSYLYSAHIWWWSYYIK